MIQAAEPGYRFILRLDDVTVSRYDLSVTLLQMFPLKVIGCRNDASMLQPVLFKCGLFEGRL